MRVLLNAYLSENPGAGGIQVYLGALVKALGELTDGNEEYVLITNHGHDDWLRKLCGPNQRVQPYHDLFPGLGYRIVNKLRRMSRGVLDCLSTFRTGGAEYYQRFSRSAPLVPISTGFLESLGGSVIHFPYQDFVVTSLPSVFNPHDLQHRHLPQFFKPETIMERELTYPFACRLATKIAVASDWIADDVCHQYGVSRSKIAVIPWGAATAAQAIPSDTDVERLRRTYDLPKQYVFYPATAWLHKNHRRLIEAADLLKKQGQPVSVVFSGGATGFTPALKQQVSDAGLDGIVRFLGHLPSEDMRALYRGATAAIIPTLFEALSGPMAEAWQEGVPVGCSDIPQLRQQAGDAALLFDPTSSASIANAVRILVTDDAKRRQLVGAGTRKLAGLQWKTTALRYRDLYREAAQYAGEIGMAPASWKL